jgi:hypothetical protein
MYFILFDAMVNWIVPLISFSDSSLLQQKHKQQRQNKQDEFHQNKSLLQGKGNNIMKEQPSKLEKTMPIIMLITII